MKLSLPVVDAFGRSFTSSFVEGEIERRAWTRRIVPPNVSGIPRPMSIFLAKKPPNTLIKWSWHGDTKTFCPPIWADIAIGSGACGFGCRSCFLMLTFREMRDPLQPVVYTNGDDYERQVGQWLRAPKWGVNYTGPKGGGKKQTTEKRWRRRTPKDAIGLGIDCADSLLWEGVTGHARRLIPLFTDPKTNPLGNPLILLTKSANTHYLTELSDAALQRVNGKVPNVAVTMSLNPEAVADLWEGKFPGTLERITPPIQKRLEALRVAQDLGFDVRVRVDPILTPEHWKEVYSDFFVDMVRVGLKPSMITLGTYREKNPQLEAWGRRWGLPAMEFGPEVGDGREGTHHHVVERAEIYNTVATLITGAFSNTGHAPWVSLCKETHDVRKATGLCSANCNCLTETKADKWRLPLVG